MKNSVKQTGSINFKVEGSAQFKLTDAVVAQMLIHRQHTTNKPEAGGVLLGRYLLDCDDVVVDQITEPMDDDKQSRFRFFRAAFRHQKAIDTAWRSTNGTCNYLGEWHTHPESKPTPSAVDLFNWRRRLLCDKYDNDHLFFVIVGTRIIRAWQGTRTSLRIEQLSCFS